MRGLSQICASIHGHSNNEPAPPLWDLSQFATASCADSYCCAVQRSGSSGTLRIPLSRRVSPAGPLISPHRMHAVRWPSETAGPQDMRASPARRHGLDLGSRPLPEA